MMGAMAGGDALEIIVALRDLTSSGFAHVRGELAATEAAANGTNLGGASKALNTLERDAESAAGSKGGGGIGGMASGLLALGGGPVTVAVAAIGLAIGAGIALTGTYDKIEVQEKALAIAAKDHGIALDDLNKFVEKSISENVSYGFSAGDTRGAITKLTEAGMSLADQQKAMGPIMDLAKAKHISMADAAKVYELAIMGNAKALKEYGIALPKVDEAQKAVDDSTKKLATDQDKLTTAQNALTLLQDKLTAKTSLSTTEQIALRKAHDAVALAIREHGKSSTEAAAAQQKLSDVEATVASKMKLTAAESDQLRIAQQKVSDASTKLKTDQAALDAATAKLNDTGGRAAMVNDAITKAVGDQREATSPLDVAQAKLGNTWEHLATAIGPGLEDIFGRLIDALSTMLGWVADVATSLSGPLATAFGIVGPIIGGVGDIIGGLIGLLSQLFGWIGQVVGAIANGPIGGLISGVSGAVGGLVNSLPHFASGGVVNPRSGGTLAIIGEGHEREAVIPESKWGSLGGGRGSGSTVVHTQIFLDGQLISEVVDRHLGLTLANRAPSASGPY